MVFPGERKPKKTSPSNKRPCYISENIVILTCMDSVAGPRSAVGRAPDSYVRCPGFDTRSGHILSFLLPLIQEGQLSVLAKVYARSTG